ncbi:hypothetical protein C8Q76DRAFT_696417 [Earliella scabrosa]|nr:hypothetical protein C8Q76DRAFT_696417 [Earliella scabrosa]
MDTQQQTANGDALEVESWVPDKVVKRLERYVQKADRPERTFAVTRIPWDECVWRSGALCFANDLVSLAIVGLVKNICYQHSIHTAPYFEMELQLLRQADRDALTAMLGDFAPTRHPPAETLESLLTMRRNMELTSETLPVYDASERLVPKTNVGARVDFQMCEPEI